MCGSSVGYAQIKDTLRINDSAVDDPIMYSARDSIYTDLRTKTVHLYGDAKVDYGSIKMNAGYIMIDLNKNEVLAKYAFDADSNEVEAPTFTDGSDEIKARTIRYNFDTEKGFIEEVAIQQDENFLYMETAKRHSNEEVHFKKGRFTTCNLEEPHYHFQLSKAVMIPNKRIVSGPMNLYISNVPTPIGLPFSVIPQAEERSKGLVFPEFVPTSQYGFGLNDLGYYLPINDYVQTTFYGSIYSRGSWGLRNQTDYFRKYAFKGNLNLGFQQFRSGFPTNTSSNKLTFIWSHQKDRKSSPYWSFTSKVNFISDNNNQNNLDPLNPNYFNNTLASDINLSRAFPGKPVTAGLKLNLRQNSISENVSLTSPILNVNMTRIFPFRSLVNGSRGWRQAISQFGVTYNFEGQNRAVFGDSLIRQNDFQGINDRFLNGINQSMTMQTTIGIFKNTVKITPSLNYSNKINFQSSARSFDTTTNTFLVDTLQRTSMGHNVSFNAQATTVIYSYYRFVGKKEPLLRHLLTPTVSFRYIPSLNEPITETAINGIDTFTVTYSPTDISIYSIGSTRDQALLNFGFNNTFELKRKSEKDTVDGFKRTRIVDAFTINGNYDFLKDSMNLSDISLALRVNPIPWLNFVSNATFSPYSWVDSTGAKTADFALNERGTLGRFLTTNFTTTITLTSKESRDKLNETVDLLSQNWNSDYNYFLLHPEHAINFDIPWKVSLSHVYTINTNQNITEFNSDRFNQLQTLMLNGDVSFTKRWKLSTTTNLDLTEFDITNSRFTLTRDMHCWALSFFWTPVGLNKSFVFSIRNTSALFQDAKIDIRKPPAFL